MRKRRTPTARGPQVRRPHETPHARRALRANEMVHEEWNTHSRGLGSSEGAWVGKAGGGCVRASPAKLYIPYARCRRGDGCLTRIHGGAGGTRGGKGDPSGPT